MLQAAIQVQILQPDGFKTENSGLRRSGLNLTSPDLTFCIAFNPYYINTDLSSLVSYATDDDDNALVISMQLSPGSQDLC